VRIQLKTGLAILRRGPSTAQIGLDRRHGTVLDGLDETDFDVLSELAGGVDETALTRPPRDRAAADRAYRVRRLVTALAGSGALLSSRSGRATLGQVGDLRPRLVPDAAAWSLTYPSAGDGWGLLAARRRRTVEIHGSGRIAPALAAALAAAGVGAVPVSGSRLITASDTVPGGATPSDIGLPGEQVAQRAVRYALGRAEADAGADDQTRAAADLVVLIDRAAADATRADRYLSADIPHLAIVTRETSVLVGPLVVPGHGPCLRCLDLHRSDLDGGWPLLLAQLLGQAGRGPGEETSLAQLSAALASLQILEYLDGHTVPAAVAATLEVELPDGLVSRRPWPAHAACGCHWPPTGDGGTRVSGKDDP
jgi:hypothetical protein